MVIELSGVQFGLKSYAWIQNQMSTQHEVDLKSQVWFQTKITRHEVQLPLNCIHFEIAQITGRGKLKYFIDAVLSQSEIKFIHFLGGKSKSFGNKSFTYFDWFVELEELGNVCNHDVHVWGNSGSLIPFSFAIKTDKKRNPFFGFHEKFCGVFLKVPVIEDFVNFCKLCPDCNHSWCCFCFARFPIKMSVTVSIKWSSSTTIRSSGIFNSFVYFTLCTSIVGCCPLESKHL